MRGVPALLFAALIVGAADTGTDTFLNGIAVILIVLPVWDWRVALKTCRAAYKRPRYEALTSSALSSFATAVAATIAGALGINRIEAVLTGTPGFIPPTVALGLLALALIVVSLPNIYTDRLYRRWKREFEANARQHKRIGDQRTHPHRRWDDPPEV